MISDHALAGAQRILVIKLGAFGDFLLALGPMQALRRFRPDAHITLLTTRPYRAMAEASGVFDDILLDERPGRLDLAGWLDLRRLLRTARPDFVVDLQTSDRSSFYRLLLLPDRPFWSGIARGSSHPHANAGRDHMHTVERQAEQMEMAGMPRDSIGLADLSFLEADLAQFRLPERFMLLVPGGAPHRPDKRWPAERYGAYAAGQVAQGITPVIIGTEAEREAAETILEMAPGTQSLLGRTSFADIAALARKAEAALGNDTGPMHLIALAGCPTTVLFSNASDPALCRPRGPNVRVIREPDLRDLTTI